MQHRKCRRGKHLAVYSGEARTPPMFRSCARKKCAWVERRGIINDEGANPSDRLAVRTWDSTDGDYETENEIRVHGSWGVPVPARVWSESDVIELMQRRA